MDAFLEGHRVATPVLPSLTAREREVVDLVARGCRNPAIAAQLHLSPKTVRNMVSSAMTELGAGDRTALALLAREAGLGLRERPVQDVSCDEPSR